jgi:hypothetical protein
MAGTRPQAIIDTLVEELEVSRLSLRRAAILADEKITSLEAELAELDKQIVLKKRALSFSERWLRDLRRVAI